MVELSKDLLDQVQAACQANAGELTAALSRALDSSLEVAPREATTLQLAALPEGFDGPGLVVLIQFGKTGALAVIPASTGLLPAWVNEPDASGASRLETLGQELSMLLVPDDLIADRFQAARVESIQGVLAKAELDDGAPLLPLEVKQEGSSGTLSFVWPVGNPENLLAVPPEAASAESPPEEGAAPSPAEQPPLPDEQPPPSPKQTATLPGGEDQDAALARLPAYARSLLQIKIPVTVTLAATRQSIHEITELTAGSIIKFEKSCDELLDLEVGGQCIAQGECVKVGDKFGLRITSMTLPGERFIKQEPPRS